MKKMSRLLISVLVMVITFMVPGLCEKKEKIIKLSKNREKRITYYQNGNKKDEFEYLKGKKHGKYTMWYESGEKEQEGVLYEGLDHGTITSWYKNGKKKGAGKFDKGTGRWTEYYPDGSKRITAGYSNGELHGKIREWYENGSPYSELEFKDGKKHGLWTSWYKDGAKFNEVRYEDDKEVWKNETLIARSRGKFKVQYEVVKPKGFSPETKYPLLLLLHGRGGNLKSSRERWKTEELTNQFLIAFVQSSQAMFWLDCYSWDDSQTGRKDIKQVYEDITGSYPVDKDRVIIAGMSAGGKMAIDTALNGIIPVKGFIACCPPKPEGFNKEIVQKSARRGIRGTIIAGERDSHLVGAAREMAAVFKENKLPHRLVIIPGMGHAVPEDSQRRLKAAIAHIYEEKND